MKGVGEHVRAPVPGQELGFKSKQLIGQVTLRMPPGVGEVRAERRSAEGE